MFGGFGGQGGFAGGLEQRVEQSLINQFVPGGANGPMGMAAESFLGINPYGGGGGFGMGQGGMNYGGYPGGNQFGGAYGGGYGGGGGYGNNYGYGYY